jgi:hypothetical protein
MTTNGLVIHDLQIHFQFRILTCDPDLKIFHYEKENHVKDIYGEDKRKLPAERS